MMTFQSTQNVVQMTALTFMTVKIPFGMGITRSVCAGPYRAKPWYMDGIKLAPEEPGDAVITLPIADFSVPSLIGADMALYGALKLLADNATPLYVGCRGGYGRTGLFLSLLLKQLGEERPIEWVRRHYSRRAVETLEQERFIEEYEPKLGVLALLKLRARAIWADVRPGKVS